MVVGCAGPNGSDAPVNSKPGAVASFAYVLSGGVKVAYVLNIKDGYASVYIPSVDRYAAVNPLTGLYESGYFPYFSGSNCTGEARVTFGFGEPGKSIIFDGTSSYYLITSMVLGTFNTQSSLYNGVCTNSVGSFPRTFPLTLSTRPYDFGAIAPLSIQYQ